MALTAQDRQTLTQEQQDQIVLATQAYEAANSAGDKAAMAAAAQQAAEIRANSSPNTQSQSTYTPASGGNSNGTSGSNDNPIDLSDNISKSTNDGRVHATGGTTYKTGGSGKIYAYNPSTGNLVITYPNGKKKTVLATSGDYDATYEAYLADIGRANSDDDAEDNDSDTNAGSNTNKPHTGSNSGSSDDSSTYTPTPTTPAANVTYKIGGSGKAYAYNRYNGNLVVTSGGKSKTILAGSANYDATYAAYLADTGQSDSNSSSTTPTSPTYTPTPSTQLPEVTPIEYPEMEEIPEYDEEAAQEALAQYQTTMADYMTKLQDAQAANDTALAETIRLAISRLESQKPEILKQAAAANDTAYKAYMTASNPYGVGAESTAMLGLGNSGYAESSRVALGNTYQQAINTNENTKNTALNKLTIAMDEAQMNGDIARAQAAATALQNYVTQGIANANNLMGYQQAELTRAQEYALQRAQMILSQTQLKYQVDSDNATNKYNRDYAQAQLDQNNNQYNSTMSYNQSQDALSQQQYTAEQAYNQQQANRDYALSLANLGLSSSEIKALSGISISVPTTAVTTTTKKSNGTTSGKSSKSSKSSKSTGSTSFSNLNKTTTPTTAKKTTTINPLWTKNSKDVNLW